MKYFTFFEIADRNLSYDFVCSVLEMHFQNKNYTACYSFNSFFSKKMKTHNFEVVILENSNFSSEVWTSMFLGDLEFQKKSQSLPTFFKVDQICFPSSHKTQ